MFKYHNIVNNLIQREISLNKFYSTPKLNSDQIIKSSFGLSDKLYRTDLFFHRGCVNCVKFSNNGEFMVSGGDDMIVTLWNVEKSLMKKYEPKIMKLKHRGNIFSVTLDSDNTNIFSGGTDQQLIIHRAETGDLITSRFLDSAICDISLNPSDDNVIALGCEDGKTLLFDCRTNVPETIDCSSINNSYKSIEYNPVQSHLLLVASNCDKDVSLIDLRNKKTVFQYLSPFNCLKGAMCARYNSKGDQILVLRKRLSVALYNSNNQNELCEFDSFGFFNTITQKTVCFAGPNDEFVAAPSDDFNIYLYKIPEDLKYNTNTVNESENMIRFIKSADFTLKGHNSIVNQVSYNYQRSLLASSGVGNVIKYWSPFPLSLTKEESKEDFSTTSNDRQINSFSHRTVTMDLSENNLNGAHEDADVLYYFDNLIRHNFCQDEIEEFIDLDDTTFFENFKVVDPEFDHDLYYIKSLIHDFKQNGKSEHESLFKKLKVEQLIDKKEANPNIVKTGSISYLFNNKKIKQSEILLKRAYKLIQERLRFIRKCKKEEDCKDEDWLENVQKMIDNEPELKKMLVELNNLYKEKRIIESISSPLYYDILKRLTKLFFRIPSIRLYIQSDLDDPNIYSENSTEIDEMINEISNMNNDIDDSDESLVISNNTENNSNNNTENNSNNNTENNTNNNHHTDSQTSTDSSSDLKSFKSSGLTLSDTSLSAGSVLDDEKTSDNESIDDGQRNNKKKSLKRKKSVKSSFKSKSKYLKKVQSKNELKPKISSNAFNFNLPSSSDSNSSDDDRPILKFKRSNKLKNKTKNYNLYAFDKELDLDSNTTNSSSTDDSMKAEYSNFKKHSLNESEDEEKRKKCQRKLFENSEKDDKNSKWNLKDQYSSSTDTSESDELLNRTNSNEIDSNKNNSNEIENEIINKFNVNETKNKSLNGESSTNRPDD